MLSNFLQQKNSEQTFIKKGVCRHGYFGGQLRIMGAVGRAKRTGCRKASEMRVLRRDDRRGLFLYHRANIRL
jgi:hypothetical protein